MTNSNRQTTKDSAFNRQELILKHYPLVRKIAVKMVKSYPSYVDVNDLIQIGVLGLMDAIDRYQPERFPSFVAYARIRIQGSILDDRRAQDWTPRSVRDRSNTLERAKKALHRKLDRSSTNKELAKYMGLSVQKLEKMQKTSEIRTVLSMEHGADDSLRIGDLIPTKGRNPHENLLSNENKKAVLQCLKNLPEREARLVNLHYFKGESFQRISLDFGVSEARISQIHTRVKSKMQAKLSYVINQ